MDHSFIVQQGQHRNPIIIKQVGESIPRPLLKIFTPVKILRP